MKTSLVGITAWKRQLDTYLGPEVLQTLSDYYSEAVISAGMTPMILPNAQDPTRAEDLVGLIDGLILSGGDDVDPEAYGEETTASIGQNPAVDQFEIALVRAAQAQNKPVLAICRGLQLLNVALGGTLNQEVTGVGAVHELIDEDTDTNELNQRHHVVALQPDSILAASYGSEELKVNTLHHQGIKELARDLIVEGKTEDGLIEAARCGGEWWALGVQWHPERGDLAHRSPLMSAFRSAMEATAAPIPG